MTLADRLRALTAAALLLLPGCTGTALPPPPSLPVAAIAQGCRVAADGGPDSGSARGTTLADRGIGGTGAPANVQTADRGIGGTGINNSGINSTGANSTGTNTTGIIGVITGFASICLGGQEVGYDPALPILVDGQPATTAALRAGQLALVDATGPETGLQASRVIIRHEVTGPVQSSFVDQAGGRMMRVAGQRVAAGPATLGDTDAPIGAWVAVSGFRDPDGIIHATRIDRQIPGEARIAGPLTAEGGHIRIGTAEIVPAPGTALPPSGQDVVVAGRWSDGVLYVAAAEPDLLLAEPAAFFGPGVATLVIESYAGLNQGRLVIGRIQQRADGHTIRRSVVEIARRPDGALQPATIRDIRPAAPAARAGQTRQGRFEPAPLPSRGASDTGRPGGRDGTRDTAGSGYDRRRLAPAARFGDPDAGPGAGSYGGGFGGPGFGGPGFGGPAFGGPQGSPAFGPGPGGRYR